MTASLSRFSRRRLPRPRSPAASSLLWASDPFQSTTSRIFFDKIKGEMSSLCCHPRWPAVKTPLEDDDLLGEILLRLPPQPSSLPRASLVCKRWRSLASDPGFFRRFRRHHRRNPPLLGFFNRDEGLSFMPTLEAPNRVPPVRFSLQLRDRFRSLGCRHGLVLIFNITQNQMLVWDPVTGDQHHLAIPPVIGACAVKTAINGAVLRVGDAHFQVVLTEADNDDKQHRRALACVYSSETGLWGDLISTPLPYVVPVSASHSSIGMSCDATLVYTGNPAVLVGDCLYWILSGNFNGILEFDLEKQRLAVIRVPLHILQEGSYQFWIMRAEGGGLGVLIQSDIGLQLWKRNIDREGAASWTLGRTIEIAKLLSLESGSQTVLGFAEENKVVILWACGVLFMVHLESLQYKKLFETWILPHYHPFESLYTADIADGHDGADPLHNT